MNYIANLLKGCNMGKVKKAVEEQPVQAAEEEVVVQTSKQEAPAPVLTHKAFGIFKAKNGEWTVSVIEYNPVSGEVGSVGTIGNDGFRDMAIERFKIEAGHMLYQD